MTRPDLQQQYRDMLARLYPGEEIEVPASIEIRGGTPEKLSIDFGIVKEGSAWRIPEPFGELAEPVLLREAYRAGFPAKTAKQPSMIHICAWLAWTSIEDKRLKKRFFDIWLAASVTETPGLTLYQQPPVLIREIDRGVHVDPRELHGLLVRYSAENERLLGKQLRHDTAEAWAFDRVVEAQEAPPPPVMELFCSYISLLLKGDGEMPGRNEIIAGALERPRFTTNLSQRMLDHAFSPFGKIAQKHNQANVSWYARRYVYLVFAPRSHLGSLIWEDLLHIPGIHLSTQMLQGNILDEDTARGRTIIARYSVPTNAIDEMLDFFDALAAHGFIEQYDTYILADSLVTINLNSYVPDAAAPDFTIDPIRADPDLFASQLVEYDASPLGAREFLASITKEGLGGMRAFVDRLMSPFSLSQARHDSWLESLASTAGVSAGVARRWLDLVTHRFRTLVPDPRSSYLFNPNVPIFSHMVFTVRPSSIPSDRLRLASRFPSTFSSIGRGARGAKDRAIWNVCVPQGDIRRAICFVAELASECKAAVSMRNPLVKPGYSTLAWYDGEGYERASEAIRAYTAALPRLARGEWTLTQYVNQTARSVDALRPSA